MFSPNSAREEAVDSTPILNISEDDVVPSNKKSKKSGGKKKQQKTTPVKEGEDSLEIIDDEKGLPDTGTIDIFGEDGEDEDEENKMMMDNEDDDWTSLDIKPSGSFAPIPVITRGRVKVDEYRDQKSCTTDPYEQIRVSLIESVCSQNYGFERDRIVRCVNAHVNHEQLENIIYNKLMRE